MTSVGLGFLVLSLGVGCGGIPPRAVRVRDVVRAAICESVLGAADTDAVVAEVEVNVARTTTATFSTQAGVEGVFSVTGEASIENESGVTVHIQRGEHGEGLPSAERCLELNSQGFPVYELRDRDNHLEAVQIAGALVPGTTGFAEAQMTRDPATHESAVDPQIAARAVVPSAERHPQRISRALCDGPARHWREPASAVGDRSAVSARCDASLESGAVMWNVRTESGNIRWQVPVEGGVNDCVCTKASPNPPGAPVP